MLVGEAATLRGLRAFVAMQSLFGDAVMRARDRTDQNRSRKCARSPCCNRTAGQRAHYLVPIAGRRQQSLCQVVRCRKSM